jgi:hypothetical protein
MKAPVIFGLVVRSMGVFLLYQAVHALVGVLTMLIATPNFQGMPGLGQPSASAFVNILLLACAAIWFLFGAQPIQQWAYPEEDSAKARDTAPVQPTIPCDGPPCVSCGQAIPRGAKMCPHCGWTQP